jgi:hypothetical protein
LFEVTYVYNKDGDLKEINWDEGNSVSLAKFIGIENFKLF